MGALTLFGGRPDTDGLDFYCKMGLETENVFEYFFEKGGEKTKNYKTHILFI